MKICARCGREMTWRKKWARNWDSIRYCGERCRRNPLAPRDRMIEAALRKRALGAAEGATFCPSEVARACAPEGVWRDWMEPVREAARRLIAAGDLEMLQKGSRVDPSTAKGAIRLRGTRALRDAGVTDRSADQG